MNTEKLENPERIAELNPSATLKRIGLGENDILCDIGAGTGIFSIPAAKITSNAVFSVEINNDLIAIIESKAQKEKLKNIKTLIVEGTKYNIPDSMVDFALLVTVFHEIDEKKTVLNEISRILKKSGKLAIIEFHNRPTSSGPPVSHRIGKEDTNIQCVLQGFIKTIEFDLGDNFYCIVFDKD